LMAQILSLPIASGKKVPERVGRRGGSGLQSPILTRELPDEADRRARSTLELSPA